MFGYDIDQRIPGLDDMPLLAEYVDRLRPHQPLAGFTGLFIQHQLGTQVPMTESLIALGLEPESITWLDVPYTASSRVRHHLTDVCRIPAENFWVNRYRVLDSYAMYQRRRVQELVRDMLDLRPERLIVLDDGAYFIEAAAAFKARLPDLAIVEQTTRGFIKIGNYAALKRFSAQVPIINVAGSQPKLDLESPWIGTAVIAALNHHVAALHQVRESYNVDRPTNALVLGYGAIGRQVAKELRGRYPVHVYDPDPTMAGQAEADGFRPWDRDDFHTTFGVVVGCSGRPSFGVGDYVYLEDRAILVSASSGSVEFSRKDFIDLAATSGADDIWIDTDGLHEDQIHRPLFLNLVDREAAFLNSGFPINFDGRVNCIPARYIQPTALVMVQGALQAAAATEPGCVQLDPKFCRWLDEAFRKTLEEDELSRLPASPTREPRPCW